jgi:flavin reductase (DIM6/NTAB) family NADH-FMN oxidoreductase RutF
MHLDPKKANISDIQRLLLGGVSPRPIALVSTISEDGTNNLSPFSFFNAFGANPPVVGFSASRRVRDGGLKDTYNNLMATKECVIQAVTYDMVEQVSLSSTEYDTGVDEFIKSGLTPIDSYLVKAKRVKESPFQMECKLIDMINFSNEKGAGNLAICEVVYFHADDDIFDNGIIHPDLIDLVGRNSGNFYTRASGEALFEIEKPLVKKGIGYDNIPDFIKESHIFTANNLGRLGNSEILPDDIDVKNFINSFEKIEGSKSSYKRAFNQKNHKNMLVNILSIENINKNDLKVYLQEISKIAIENNDIDFAWKTILYTKLI